MPEASLRRRGTPARSAICGLRVTVQGRAALALAVATAVAAALGPEPPATAQDAKITVSEAHVAENDAASECIKGARKHLAERRYAKAAEAFQHALEEWGDNVFPIEEDKDDPLKPTLYVSVRRYCRQALIDLPPEGKEAYLAAFESRIQAQVRAASAARDTAALTALVERYPISPSAYRASARLGLLLVERGQPQAAIPALERALAGLPAAESAPLAAPLGVAYARAGRRDSLLDLIQRTRDLQPPPQVAQGDKVVPVLLLLQQLFDRLPATPAAAAPEPRLYDRWPAYGGSSARVRPMQPGLELLPRVWNFQIPLAAGRPTAGPRIPFLRDPTPDGEDSLPPFFPALVDGTVYVHNETTMYALDALSARPDPPQWRFETGVQPEQILYERNALQTCTVAGGRVFANLVTDRETPEKQLDWLDVKIGFPLRALFAFDTTTGKILWKVGGLRQGADFALRASFGMAPAVEGDSVYAGAVFYREQTDPIQHFVCCLDAATGRIKWTTDVASGFGEMNLFNNSTRESVGSAVSVLGDAVYYCTNLGVIACLDRETGARRWVRRYRVWEIPPVRDIYPDSPHRSAWINNPILALPGYLFVTPTDSPYLYCLDPETGEAKWTFGRTAETRATTMRELRRGFPEEFYYLAGVGGDCVYLTGEAVCALQVARKGELKWKWSPPDGRASLVAAGGLTPDHVVVPGRRRLYRIDLKTGKADSFPWQDQHEDPGNLVMADGILLAASPSGISAFFSQETIDRHFADALAQSPEDPYLRSRVAANLAKTHAYEKAAEQWARVVELLRGRTDAEALELALKARRSLFRLYLDLGRARWKEGRPDDALVALRSARASSPDARGALEAIFGAYDLLREAGRWKESLTLMSEVLRDYPDETYGRSSARDAAKVEIDRILAAAGRPLYADLEAAAEKLLAAGGPEPAEATCLEVLRLYPNSRAAETAALRLAQDLRQQGRVDEAIERLRAYVKDYAVSEHTPEAYAALIELYEGRTMYTSARGLMAQLQRRFPNATLRLEGAPVPVKTWIDRRLAGAAYSGSAKGGSASELGIPAQEAWRHVEVGTEARLWPIGGPVVTAAGETLAFLGAGDLLQAVDVQTGRLVWKKSIEGGLRKLHLHDRTLVLLGRFALTGIEADTGTEVWRCELDDLVTEAALSRGVVFLSARTQSAEWNVVAVDAARGQRLWSFPVGAQLEEVLVSDEYVVLPFRSNREVTVIDRETGQPQRTIRLGQRTLKVFLLEPDKLAVLASSQLMAYELSTGKLLWQEVVGPLGADYVAAGGLDLCYFSTTGHELVVLDPDKGKATARLAIPDLRSLSLLHVEQGTAWLAYRAQGARHPGAQAGTPVSLSACALKDGKRLWTTETSETQLRVFQDPLLTRGHFLLVTEAAPDSPRTVHAPHVLVLERSSGALVQTIQPEIQGNTPSRAVLVGDTLLVSTGSTVIAYRKP